MIQQDDVIPSGFPHSFDTSYAIAYGVEESLMIRHFQHFIHGNANRGQNFREGKFWSYDRLEDFPNHFPYWTVKQVRRILASLIKQSVIIKGEFNERWCNRTAWYAFKDQDKFVKNIKVPKTPLPVFPDLPIWATEKCPNGQMSAAQMGNCIDTTTITTTITNNSLKVQDACEVSAAKAADEILKEDSKNPKRDKPEFSPKVREVCKDLINIIITHEPEYSPPKNLSAFLTEVDFLLRIDKREPSKICDVLNWALADSFWRDKMFKPNPAKYLREKFLQLKNKMEAKPEVVKKERKFAPSSDDAKSLAKIKEWSKNAL